MRETTAPETIEQFITDESGTFQASGVKRVVYAETEDEVAEVLRQATATGEPVTVSGAGTGITGARVAVHGGTVLAMERMRRPAPRDLEELRLERFGEQYVIYLDAGARLAYCPPGIPLDALAESLPGDLFYPPDPTEASALLGSTVATDASGSRTYYYGSTRAWVDSLRVVLPNGDLVAVNRGEVAAEGRTLRFTAASGQTYEVQAPSYSMPGDRKRSLPTATALPATKDAAGLYAAEGMDLMDLFIGCEGILGVVTEVGIRLTERPEIASDIAFFRSEEAALAYVAALRAAEQEGGAVGMGSEAGVPQGLGLLSLEYFDANSLRFMHEQPAVKPEYKAAVLIEVAVDDPEAIELLGAVFEDSDLLEDWFADGPGDMAEHRDFRHALPEGVNSYLRARGSTKLGTDLAVPAEAFAEMLAAYREAGRAFEEAFPREGMHWVLFGHIGDYHLHMNFLTDSAEERAFASARYAELAQRAIDLGGTISAEHGVGKKVITVAGRELPYLELMYGPEALAEIVQVKRALDPALILNLGNIVPRHYL